MSEQIKLLIRSYFQELRFDDKHHLGLGDIRLTIGQQLELEKLVGKKIQTFKNSQKP